ncbi:MAG: caspase family protein [Polyangiaceae bacterium]|nr:caspase family protein [Polyangiaceae bacterium]
MNQNYALIIGVHEYRDYDPSGNADIPGARNDARAWVRSCLSIGFSPRSIRVLASPPLSAAELGPGAEGVQFGAADRDSIIDGLTWLSEQIGGDAAATGLMTFSGHGDAGNDGCPLLCPANLTNSLEEVIDVAAIRAKAAGKVKGNLTAMLDCCHAQVEPSSTIRGKLRATKAIATGSDRGRVRVVAACMQDQESVSACFAGDQMGAFTWAVTSTLGQWKSIVDNGVAYLDVSHGNLLMRVRVLLGALSFEQIPVMSGPQDMKRQAFLYPGSLDGHGDAEIQPTETRSPRQLDTGTYQMNIEDGRQFAYIVATGANPPERMRTNTEYWYTNDEVVPKLKDADNGSITMIKLSDTPTMEWLPNWSRMDTRDTTQVIDWGRPSDTPIAYAAKDCAYLYQGTDNIDWALSFVLKHEDTQFRYLQYLTGKAGNVPCRLGSPLAFQRDMSGTFPQPGPQYSYTENHDD